MGYGGGRVWGTEGAGCGVLREPGGLLRGPGGVQGVVSTS